MAADDPRATPSSPPREDYRHLPDAVAWEDTVTSVRGDTAPEPGGEPNPFIGAAIEAGG